MVSFLISAETYYTLKERPILTMFIHCIYIYILDHTCLCKLSRYPHYSTLSKLNNNSKCYLDYICLHDNFSSKFKNINHAILSYNIIHFRFFNHSYKRIISHWYYPYLFHELKLKWNEKIKCLFLTRLAYLISRIKILCSILDHELKTKKSKETKYDIFHMFDSQDNHCFLARK